MASSQGLPAGARSELRVNFDVVGGPEGPCKNCRSFARAFLSSGGWVASRGWAAKMRAPGEHNGAPGGETVALATILGHKSGVHVCVHGQ